MIHQFITYLSMCMYICIHTNTHTYNMNLKESKERVMGDLGVVKRRGKLFNYTIISKSIKKLKNKF